MGGLTRRSRGGSKCCIALTTVSVAVLTVSLGIITVQANSSLKDDEIEAYLNRFNKPAVKTIVLDDGDIIDCVYIYKQPAFDHPLLKDHKILMAPSSLLKRDDEIAVASPQAFSVEATLQSGEECPEGTIPILRTQENDFKHVNSLDGYGTLDVHERLVERAGLIARGGTTGASGQLNVWGLTPQRPGWSHADIELSDDQKSAVEAGWLVNPNRGVYKDNQTRTYVYWTADAYIRTGCYNLQCPGFIQTNRKVALGAVISPLSVYGGKQYEIRISILKDEAKKAWWVAIGREAVGYWPISIFENSSFTEAATVKWIGGVIDSRIDGRHTTTPMGSGHFPNEGMGKAAFIREWQIQRDRGFDYPDPSSIAVLADNPKCYDAKLDANARLIYYGGPGLGADGCV